MFCYQGTLLARSASHCYVYVSFGRILPKTKMALNGYCKDRFVNLNFITAIRIVIYLRSLAIMPSYSSQYM